MAMSLPPARGISDFEVLPPTREVPGGQHRGEDRSLRQVSGEGVEER